MPNEWLSPTTQQKPYQIEMYVVDFCTKNVF